MFAFACLLFAAGLSTGVIAREEAATCTRVVDGDTIEVRIDSRTEQVRLIGVDTPETVHPSKPVEYFGKEASAFTRNLVEGKKVTLHDEPQGQNRDRYGRLLRYVYLQDGTFVNAEIIKQGYGHAYVKYPFSHMDEFRTFEGQARDSGLGLWAGTDSHSDTGRSRAPTGEVFVGSSSSRKYHRLDCGWAQQISDANRVTFRSPEAAQSLAYVPCAVCNPPTSSTPSLLVQHGVGQAGDPATWRFSRSPNVASKTYDGKATLVNTETQQVHVLNEVGSFIWNLCSTPKTRREIVTAVFDTYETTREQAGKDVDEFLLELQEKRLVIITKEP